LLRFAAHRPLYVPLLIYGRLFVDFNDQVIICVGIQNTKYSGWKIVPYEFISHSCFILDIHPPLLYCCIVEIYNKAGILLLSLSQYKHVFVWSIQSGNFKFPNIPPKSKLRDVLFTLQAMHLYVRRTVKGVSSSKHRIVFETGKNLYISQKFS